MNYARINRKIEGNYRKSQKKLNKKLNNVEKQLDKVICKREKILTKAIRTIEQERNITTQISITQITFSKLKENSKKINLNLKKFANYQIPFDLTSNNE